MSRVRARGNKRTVLALVHLLHAHGIAGWRRHAKIFAKPDFVFLSQKIAIFVDGCFWHGCQEQGSSLVNKAAFWVKKLTANKIRDRLVNRTLKAKWWLVLRIWEHDLSAKSGV